MIYLDTSALIKLYLREDGSELVQDLVESQNEALPVWELQEAELINALRLKVSWGDITGEQADGQLELFDDRKRRRLYFFPRIDRSELMGSFRKLGGETPRLGCRTMDIFHVACAVQLKSDYFVSFDRRQRSLAEFAGMALAPKTLPADEEGRA